MKECQMLGNRSVEKVWLVGIVLSALIAWSPFGAQAAEDPPQQQLVEQARLTVEAFGTDPSMKYLLEDLGSGARALFIIPQFLRGAFVVGGAGGSGVLIARDPQSGHWSAPAFYGIGSASFGLQVGADVSEIIVIVKSERGLKEFYSTEFTLGVGAGLAVGPEGQGASAHGMHADLIAYARKKGLFAGIALDGAVVTVSGESNRAYYGKPVEPRDIVDGAVTNPQSRALREAAANLIK